MLSLLDNVKNVKTYKGVKINTYYYPFQGIGECFRKNERKK